LTEYDTAKELHRIAEIMKLNLWLKMEEDTTTARQKSAIAEVLKTL
jgi:hypothetical protein